MRACARPALPSGRMRSGCACAVCVQVRTGFWLGCGRGAHAVLGCAAGSAEASIRTFLYACRSEGIFGLLGGPALAEAGGCPGGQLDAIGGESCGERVCMYVSISGLPV